MLAINSDFPKEGVKSESSPIIHKSPAAYLAEVIMIHKYPEIVGIAFFWKEIAYKVEYVGMVTRLQSRLKYCDFKYINNVILKNKLTSTAQPFDSLIIEELSLDISSLPPKTNKDN